MKDVIILPPGFNLAQDKLLPFFKGYLKKHFPEKKSNMPGFCYGIGCTLSLLLTLPEPLQLIQKIFNNLQFFYAVNQEKTSFPKDPELEPVILDMAERQNNQTPSTSMIFCRGLLKVETIGEFCEELLSEEGSILCFHLKFLRGVRGDGHAVFVCRARKPQIGYYLIDANHNAIIRQTDDLSQISHFLRTSLFFSNCAGIHQIECITPSNKTKNIIKQKHNQLIEKFLLLKLAPNNPPSRIDHKHIKDSVHDKSEMKELKKRQSNIRFVLNTTNISQATSDYPWLLKDFYNNDLSKRDFKRCLFKECKLANINFANSDLSRADFSGATFNEETNFSGATLCNSTFSFKKKYDYIVLNSLKNAILSTNPLYDSVLKGICQYLYERRSSNSSRLFEIKDVGMQRAETLFYALMRNDKNSEKMLNNFLSSGEVVGAISFLRLSPSTQLKNILKKTKESSEAKTEKVEATSTLTM